MEKGILALGINLRIISIKWCGGERLLAEVKFQAASVKKSFTMLVIKRQERA